MGEKERTCKWIGKPSTQWKETLEITEILYIKVEDSKEGVKTDSEHSIKRSQ